MPASKQLGYVIVINALKKKIPNIHIFRDGKGKDSFYIEKANFPKTQPPYNLTVLKGTKNVMISKKFANFLLTNQVATDYFHWIQASKNYKLYRSLKWHIFV